MISPEQPGPIRQTPREKDSVACSHKAADSEHREEPSPAEKGVDSAHDFMAKFLKKSEED